MKKHLALMEQLTTLDNIYSKAINNSVYYDSPLYDSKNNNIRILQEDVYYKLSDNKTIITIKKGFEWDESSVPYIFLWAFPKSGKYAFSALIHDALYYLAYNNSQKYCDDEFKEWMKACKISKFQTYVRWKFVRTFGFLYFNKNVNNPSPRCLRNREKLIITEIE